MVTANGYTLQPEFVVPPETVNVVVTEGGHIAALDKAGEELAAADIPLYTFINPAGLNATAGTSTSPPKPRRGGGGSAGEDNVGTIAQGFLEMSNVEIVDEMVNMIVANAPTK